MKLKALIAAKDKATYLLAGIGEKIGGAIEVTDVDDNNNMGNTAIAQYRTFSVMAKSAEAGSADVEYKKIKLSFQIRAIFEIAK